MTLKMTKDGNPEHIIAPGEVTVTDGTTHFDIRDLKGPLTQTVTMVEFMSSAGQYGKGVGEVTSDLHDLRIRIDEPGTSKPVNLGTRRRPLRYLARRE